MDWTQAENEVSLFYALRDHRPVGRDRFFHMYFILDQFSALTKKEVTSDVIWEHLRDMYDLDALNQNENEALDATLEVSEFQLPAEFDDLIAKKLQETGISSPDKNDKEKEKEKDQHKSSENEKVKEKDREADKDRERERELEKDRERKKLKVDESKDVSKDEIRTKDDPKKKDETPGKLKATSSSKKPESLKNPSKVKIESNVSANKKDETPVKKKNPSLPSSPKQTAKKAKR